MIVCIFILLVTILVISKSNRDRHPTNNPHKPDPATTHTVQDHRVQHHHHPNPYLTLTNIGKVGIHIGWLRRVSFRSPTQSKNHFKQIMELDHGYKFQLCLAFLINLLGENQCLLIFKERISELSGILSISSSSSRARPLLPIGFPLHFARALSPIRPQGHIIQRGPRFEVSLWHRLSILGNRT